MKILVTGTAGFIGFHLVNKLVENGHEIVGMDNINDYYSTELKFARLKAAGISHDAIFFGGKIKSAILPGYRFIRLNLEDKTQLNTLFSKEKFELVIHLAAQAGVRYSLTNPDAYISSNIVGFHHILEACRKFSVSKLIYASSSSVYGNNAKMPLSVADPVDNPVSLYAATKKSNELMAYTYSHLFGIDTTGLRFFTVYGPWGRPDMAYFSFTKAILGNTPIKVYNNGNLYRDFTYVDDIVEGIIRVAFKTKKGKSNPEAKADNYAIYNIGNSSPIKLTSFIEVLENALGKTAIKEFCEMQPGDVYKTYADTAPLEKEFDWKPTTSIEEGISRFVKWYLDYYN